MSFGAARRCFNGVIVVGYLRKSSDSELRLNPDDRDILEEGDRIIALANSGLPLLNLRSACSNHMMLPSHTHLATFEMPMTFTPDCMYLVESAAFSEIHCRSPHTDSFLADQSNLGT